MFLLNSHNLAGMLQSQGKNTEAEESYRRGLEGREKALGLKRRDALQRINDLAFVLSDQGKNTERGIVSEGASRARAWDRSCISNVGEDVG
jgi:hypothetical protein